MAHKIRLGFIGANVRSNWASQSHFPALLASPDVELTAVCTTRSESAEEARAAFGAKLAFDDFRAMVASPEIDAVAVVVRVPWHYAPTRAAIEAGKHVYTEWPLGRTTAEAAELAALARARGVQTAVGLQSRVSPTLLYMKEQIEAGYVGEVLCCHATAMRDGALERPSSRTWQRDVCPVRRGDPDRAEPPADVRHRRGPAPLRRYHQAGVGYGPGAARRLRRCKRHKSWSK
jgi:predicted dehydrogenase